MDWSSVIGLLVAFIGIIIGQTIDGGNVFNLFQPAPFFIVLFGTLGAVILQSKPANLIEGARKLRQVFVMQTDDKNELAARISQWAVIARREGTLPLQGFRDIETDPIAKKGLRLLIDNIPAETIREICHNDLNHYEMRQLSIIKVWDSAGGYAPTIGILAAVMGLMHVMEKLTDPTMIGGGIAVAFVATLYGVGMANLIFIPVANKLKGILESEINRSEMLIESLASIAAGEHTVIVNERLLAYL